MSGPTPRRRGRRGGGEDTRAALLDAARTEFAERAGVDAAMVNHWFGGKDALFTASLELPVDLSVIRERVLVGPPEEVGARIVHTFLGTWDAVAGGGAMVALLRSVTAHPSAARLIREFVSRVIIGPVVSTVAPDRPEERGALVASQLVGLAMVRYVLRLEPLASATPDQVVATVAPTLQRYLTGDLGSMKPDS